MCGIHMIAGVAEEHATPVIDAMVAGCAHRGPDSSAIAGTDDVFIGFNRLEIVGGANGQQPISNEDGSITVVGNGEIFNYQQLKSSHLKQHTYQTASDIEVLLHLYEEQGTDFLGALEGQFSFAIHDRSKNKIILARDRWGITPLFYAHQNGRLIVSSSVKAIIDTGLITDIALDPIGLAESWDLYGPTPPRTCFSGISQLPPSAYAEYGLSSQAFKIQNFQTLSRGSTELQDTFKQSVADRLQGSYGPGVYVSGGLDSSIIAALVNEVADKKPTLFGIAFKDPAFDESKYQVMLAEHLGCELRTVRIDTEDIIRNIDECVRFAESPLIRTAPVPMMLLSKEVRSAGIKYVLCGEGADELFAGYPVFAKGKSSATEKRDELSSFNACFIDDKVADAVAASFRDIAKLGEDLTGLRRQEIATKLSRYLLVNQGDRMAMSNSVEQRFPFLDNRVSGLAFSLHRGDLIKRGDGKLVLREAFVDLLPKELLMRKKQGYLTPDFQVVKKLAEDGVLQLVLSPARCAEVGIFEHSKIEPIIQTMDTELKARFLLFAYTTHLLHQQFLGGKNNG
jgi:asparagine synthase (glutamine-hydrolysing)